jgi:hypothetical protein
VRSILKKAGGALLLCALVFPYAKQCVRRGNDFRAMWFAWNQVLHGGYIYAKADLPDATPAHWRNPPVYAFLTSPFGLLDIKTSGFVWFYFKLALVAWAVLGIRGLAEKRFKRPPTRWASLAAWGVPLLLTVPFLNNDFTIGHMNIVNSVLIIQGLIAYIEHDDESSAVWSSLAIVVKGSAALLPIFYFARKRFRLAIATGLLACGWMALPAVVWGPSKTIEYTRDFVQSANFDKIFSDIENGWAENWGVPELVMRALGQTHPESRYGRALELTKVPYSDAALAAKAVTAALLAGLCLLWWKRAGENDLQHAALAATATLLLSLVTRKAYFGTLLLPYFALWSWLGSGRKDGRWKAVAGLSGLSVVLASLTHKDLIGRDAAFLFETWHALSFSLIALAAAQCLAAASKSPSPAEEASPRRRRGSPLRAGKATA